MKIITLGTSHGDHTRERFNSAVIVETEKGNYLLDAGSPVTGSLARLGVKPQSLKAIFISHMHGDHVGDLPVLLKAMMKYPEAGQYTKLFLPESGVDAALGAWLNALHLKWPSSLVEVGTVAEGVIYDDGFLAAAALPTNHIKAIDGKSPGSFSFALNAGNKRIVYTGDLNADFKDFPESLVGGGCDLLICETQHYDLDAALPFLSSLSVKMMLFTHVADRWHGDGEILLREKISVLPFEVHIAHDGDEFVI